MSNQTNEVNYKEVKDKFIKDLVIELNKQANQNEICFIVSAIDQQIGNHQYFLNDIAIHNYDIKYFEDNTYGYTDGTINIYISGNADCQNFYYSFIILNTYKNSAFELQKIYDYGIKEWNNKESYGEYQDYFYKKFIKNYNQKKQQEIQEIKQRMSELQNRLDELGA